MGNPKIGNFDRFILPIVRRTYPSIVETGLLDEPIPKTPLKQFVEEVFAEECPPPPPEPVMHVEPMTAPVGGVAFYRPRYGTVGRR